MSLRRFLLAALAATVVTAKDSCDEDVEIESNGDVSKIASCSTIEGSVKVGKEVTELTLTGVSEITGDLSIQGASGLGAISMPMLRTIGGAFELSELTTLNLLSAPELSKVGSINFAHLPILSALDFTKGISEAQIVVISDTQLKSLDGISLTEAKEFNVNNNKYLKEVELQLGNVSNILDFSYNAKGFSLSFPELKWANNITLRDAGSATFPKLETINSTISFVNNTFESLNLDSLTKVGKSFAIISNSKLSNLTAPELETVGGTFQIANNTKLEDIEGSFEALAEVDGSIDMAGAFTNVTFPSLEDVRGSFNLQSTEELDCDELKDAKGAVQGAWKCSGDLKTAKSSEDDSLSSSGDGSSSGSDDDEEGSAGRAAGSALAALLAAGVAVLAL